MGIKQYLNRFRAYLKRGARKERRRQTRRWLTFETLEDRTVPSTVNVVAGALTYTAAPGIANFLTIVYDSAANRYQFTDTREAITLGPGVLGGVGNFSNAVSFSAANINSLALNTLDASDFNGLALQSAVATLGRTRGALPA
jgi:hypothetical protein